MVKPIKKSEVLLKKGSKIQQKVISTVNREIAKNWNGREAIVSQTVVAGELLKLGYTTQQIYDEHMLDFEGLYRSQGWKVVYDKPGYNESYDPTWKFT